MTRALVGTLLLVVAFAASPSARAASGTSTATKSGVGEPADLLLAHGLFHTVTAGSVEGSLAVRDGRIVYLGPAAGAEALRGAETRVIELAGRTVTPGLIDAHAHLLGLGRSLSAVDLRDAASFAEVVSRSVAAAKRLPAGGWVFGRGWDQNRWPGQQFPDHAELSRALAAQPTWLVRVDGHAALANAAALAALGFDDQVADPTGGRFLRRADGTLTGVLIDAAKGLAEDRLPPASPAELAHSLALAAEHCVRLGLTTVTDMGVGDREIAAYRAALAAGELPLRAALFVGDDAALLEEWLARGPEIDSAARLLVRGIKLYVDGARGSRGAALLEPYLDDPGNLGLLVATGDHLEDVARRALARGFQVGIHAIGDRGALVALDALERALGGPRPAARFRLEHAQVMRGQDIERLARLGVIASMQPTHATSDMPWAGDRVGERRLAGAYAWRKVLVAGGRLALGSDFPVESADPRLGLYAAVTRQDLDRRPPGGWRPAERLTREEALRGFTLDAAWSLFLDEEVGSLAVGKRADVVVFAGDPLRVDDRELAKLPIDYTVVGGRIVYARAGVR